ncbi:uncharacterized protein LOC123011690 [Tribolium madens]|uniref:uncharacterized protein LOC123011690 n=1 Tax=Tribolium madens TaxID=41895 RepID=UPI001CF74C65|nr:uncharacterized protein LOC123011690 [Tribolium madens]
MSCDIWCVIIKILLDNCINNAFQKLFVSKMVEAEIKSWLTPALRKENVSDFSVKILGNSEKGDGYLGDIIFLEIAGEKHYNLVAKCSKRSKTLREKSPVKNAFLNEIFMYEKVHPTFLQFQNDHNCEKPFVSYPKCYGSFISDDMEVIILENLKKSGFELWPKKEPLSDLENLDDVLNTYFDSFTRHLKSLGISEPELLYPKSEFLKDWKKFCKFGILMSTLLMKIVSTDKDEVIDIAEAAEKGKGFTDSFRNEIRDKDNFKRRMKAIIEHVVKNDLI